MLIWPPGLCCPDCGRLADLTWHAPGCPRRGAGSRLLRAILLLLALASVAQAQLPRTDLTGEVPVWPGEVRRYVAEASFTRVRTVDASGAGDYADLASALTYVATQSRSLSEQWVVEVMPGDYTLSTTLTIPDHTKVVCHGAGGYYYGACRILADSITAGAAISGTAPYASISGFQILHQPAALTGETHTLEVDGSGSFMVENVFVWGQTDTTTYPFWVVYNNGSSANTGLEAHELNLLYIGTGGTDGNGLYVGPAAANKAFLRGGSLYVLGGGVAAEMGGNANNPLVLQNVEVKSGALVRSGTGFLQVNAGTSYAESQGEIDLLETPIVLPRGDRVKVLDCNPRRGDYDSFSAAMTALAAESRSASEQWTLLAMPCVYSLPRGTTIPAWVSVTCLGSATSLDASWGDNSPCTLSVDSGTGDALLMGDSSLIGFLVEALVSCGATNCGLVDWSGGGFVALRNVTLHATTAGWIGVRFDSTFSDRLVLEDVQAVMEGGDAESRGVVFSSAGPGWVRGLAATTAGNGGAGDIALVHAGAGDLRITGLAIEEFWGTQISHTGGGDLAVSGVTSDAALVTPTRASAPACDRAGKQYSDTTAPGALCWCDGTSWVVAAGTGSCA